MSLVEKEKKGGGRSSVRWLNGESSADQGVSLLMLQEVGILSYSGYCLSKGHSMAMKYNPNSGAGSKTVLIKLLTI